MKGKIWKKMIAGIAAVCMLASLTACGSSEGAKKADEAENIELTLGFNVETSDAAYERDIVPIFEAFMKEHPEVTNIKLTGMGKMSEDQQVTRLTGGEYDDVLLLPMSMKTTDMPNYFADLGDASELGNKYFYGDYMQDGGKTYALPIGVVYEGLVYNQKVLDECYGGKVPTTLDELMECCTAIHDAGKICFYTNAGAQWPMRFWDNLAVTMSEDPAFANTIVTNKAPWTEGQPMYQAANLLGEFAAKGYLEPDVVTEQWDASRVSIATGETAFMLIGTWAIPQLKEIAVEMGEDPENIKFAPFPYKNDVNADNKLAVRVSEDLFMGVNKNSDHLELAKELCTFFCEHISIPRGMNEALKDGGKKAAGLEFLDEMDYIQMYSSPAKDPAIAVQGGEAKLDLFSIGTYLQDYIIQPALEGNAPRFDDLNQVWGSTVK